ncbi:hypothetical protein FFLO_05993 [Filobasidium floriforme]|uniref:Uncharacterized protein n=2 Tax=Filobasidium floriforme TaxID=5210 RepID=A0A8K0JI45_9TREE|nr:hypothetical protein FFLO_05993 [Filobasidium floriforme]
MRLVPVLLALSITATGAISQSWNFVNYGVGGDQKIVSFTGSMVAPTLPRAGTYFLWPGLQPDDDSGVFQPVLDGRSGGWWFGMGWCCSNPSLAWGGGFGVDAGTVLSFNWTLPEDGANWLTTVGNGKTGELVNGEFPLGDKRFNQAILAIERYDVPWDFGPLEFRDLRITATGTYDGWCNENPWNYQDATVTTVSGVRSIIGDNLVTCVIDSFILARPAGSEVAAVQVASSSAEVSQDASVLLPSASDSVTQEASYETAVDELTATATATTSEYSSTASFDEPTATVITTQDQVGATEIEQTPTETVDAQATTETTSVGQTAADNTPVDQSTAEQPVADSTSVEQSNMDIPLQSATTETPAAELTVETTLAEQPTASPTDQPAPTETSMGEVEPSSDGITASDTWSATQIAATPQTTVPGPRKKPAHKHSKPNGQQQRQAAQNWWSWFFGWN